MSNPVAEKHIRIEIWRAHDNTLAGTDDPQQMLSCKNDQPDWVFIGQKVTYWVYCPMCPIERSEALEFCNLHHQGKLKTLSVDLSTLNPPRKQTNGGKRGK